MNGSCAENELWLTLIIDPCRTRRDIVTKRPSAKGS